MAEPTAVILEHRGVLRVAGAGRCDFLQGIVSNDVTRVAPDTALWTAFLTPQGKFLHEFFLAEYDNAFLLDCEAARAPDLARRLKLYRLRAQVTIEAAEDLAVAALIGDAALEKLDLPAEAGRARTFGDGLVFVDPRLPALGARAILPRQTARQSLAAAGFTEGKLDDYDSLRIAAGVPDGSRDLEIEKSTLLESGFAELGGIDWNKGCYMGQELTARTRYRGLIKKRLVPVAVDGPLPSAGTPVMFEGKEAGEIRSGIDGAALALIRLEALERAAASGEPFTAADARVMPRKPDWATF